MTRRLFFAALAITPALAGSLTADEPKPKEHEVTVRFPSPTPGYGVKIVEVRKVGDELWAKFQVTKPKGIGPAVIGKAAGTAKFDGPALPVKVFVAGKTWDWDEKDEKPTFVNLDKLPAEEQEKTEKSWANGKVVFAPKAEK